MRRVIFPFLIVSLTSCTTLSEGEWNTTQTALQGSPALRAEAINDCVASGQKDSLSEKKHMAAVMNTSVANVPKAFCTRLLNALVSGRITYQDYLNMKRPTADRSKMVKILQGR